MKKIFVRWMVRRDLPAVMEIEQRSFDFPWSEEEFRNHLLSRNEIGVVIEVNEIVAGYLCYRVEKCRIEILSLAVAQEFRRRGLGRKMVDYVKTKLVNDKNRLMVLVRETNIEALLFFRSQGFRVVEVMKDFYETLREDCYRFEFRQTKGTIQ